MQRDKLLLLKDGERKCEVGDEREIEMKRIYIVKKIEEDEKMFKIILKF